MKTLLSVLLLILVFPLSLIAGEEYVLDIEMGKVVSDDPENYPQQIQVHKITKSSGEVKMHFTFCPYEGSLDCRGLGRESGYTLGELEKFTEDMEREARRNQIMRPLMSMAIVVAAVGITTFSGGSALLIFTAGSISATASDAIMRMPEMQWQNASELATVAGDNILYLEYPVMPVRMDMVKFATYMDRKLLGIDTCGPDNPEKKFCSWPKAYNPAAPVGF